MSVVNAEIISIGNELLSGLTLNTNASWIAQKMHHLGVDVNWISTIKDTHGEINHALETASNRAKLVICTGGLGPTPDDLTKKAICDFFDSRPVLHKETLAHIKKLFEGRKLRMPSTNRNQAMIPDQAVVITNPYGTAPGLRLEKGDTVFFFLPGVPFEMKHLIEHYIIPDIQGYYTLVKPTTVLFRTTGLAESRLNELVTPGLKTFKNITIAFLPKTTGVDLRITFADENAKIMGKLKNHIYNCLGIHLYTEEEQNLEEVVAALLLEKGFTLGVAESFTGGLIGDLFTNIPGSSAYFKGSAVTYSNDSKARLLSFDDQTMLSHGAVSEQTVKEMVTGAQRLFNTDCAIASTGIAGPAGATADKPVGLCYLAVICKEHLETRRFIFGKDRRINKERGAYAAIELLRRVLL